jgi:hypothetical protein
MRKVALSPLRANATPAEKIDWCVKALQQIANASQIPEPERAGLAGHLADTSDAHDASAISFTPAGSIEATDVQAAIEEASGDIDAHIADTTAAHAASAISYGGGTGMSATDVEAAIDELATEKAGAAAALTAEALIVGDGGSTGIKTISQSPPAPSGNDFANIDRSGFYADQAGTAANAPSTFATVIAAGRSNNRHGLLGLSTLETSRARAWIKQLGSTVTGWAELLTHVGGINLTGGFSATSDNDGSKSSGTYTPVFVDGNIKRITNDGAFTLGVPTGEGTCVIQMTNGASAGTVTTSSFTKVSGDTITTTNAHDFFLFITKINNFSHLFVQALQ